jgi:CBS domain-containing protein
LIVGILIAKSLMWALSLGSGTSGGVLAPLLMIGGAVGAFAAHLAHASVEAQAFWALIGMGSMLAGSLGVPLTAILFSLEVTHCLPALLPLTMGCISAYLVTALLMPRSILTEKLSRRGYHLTREYGVDPLELVIVSELMSSVPQSEAFTGAPALPEVFTYADGTCRSAAELMATEGVASIPVVDRATRRVSGTLTLQDLLRGRSKAVVPERERLRLFNHSNGTDREHN